jgi:hypothetical protein
VRGVVCSSVCGSVQQCARQCAAVCGSVRQCARQRAAVRQYHTVCHQSGRRRRGADVVQSVLATTPCIINQQGAAKEGKLVALLAHSEQGGGALLYP